MTQSNELKTNSMEGFSKTELNTLLSGLIEQLRSNTVMDEENNVFPTLSTLDFCDNWEVLMPLSLKYGAYVEPLAWERSNKKYRARHMAMDEEGRMARYGVKYMSDDNDPSRALVMTLIKILKNGRLSH